MSRAFEAVLDDAWRLLAEQGLEAFPKHWTEQRFELAPDAWRAAHELVEAQGVPNETPIGADLLYGYPAVMNAALPSGTVRLVARPR